ncbi:MAG: non-canonical purine NTP pyrophosphatase [Chloroflexota bacterium]|nr:non-canonical purine NTP pyrophosphatase [Chloroflexota bacterium]
MRLLIGTNNPGKLREYGEMFASDAALHGVTIVRLDEIGLGNFDVDEPYDTFEDNARHKARAFAARSGVRAIADDSGLIVDALGGRPGVYSKRYAPGSDADRIDKLLRELADVPAERRTARFVCVTVGAAPDGSIIEARGEVEGTIAFAPGAISNGFGYDPIFVPTGYDVVFSAIAPEQKNRLSHRGLALAALLPRLRGWVRG